MPSLRAHPHSPRRDKVCAAGGARHFGGHRCCALPFPVGGFLPAPVDSEMAQGIRPDYYEVITV